MAAGIERVVTAHGARGGKLRRHMDKHVAAHVAIVMDGNGRWANAQGLPRTEGHRAGEDALMDVIAGAIEAGVKVLSVYAFSTENWRRSPREVAFLMNYSREVICRRREELRTWGVKIVWSGRQPRLWTSVINELQAAERHTAACDTLILNFCVNYGGRNEIADAAAELAHDVQRGLVRPHQVTPELLGQYMYQPDLPDVDLFIRTGGEQRTSNFLIWESPYAEYMFVDEPWPEFNRQSLWRCLESYASRDRRFGAAKDTVAEG
ncbi:di-trans,poly-cis-decaprenylcistransferase [Trueperella pecoris]|uniref:Isoprenyl transferase n=2 Tax=Trueperella pecoris TaxID=2733571 RepID=A0A7M1QSG8_9ACTO|nr:di-trans,poly-cis-decaprenylcistransferase [Trueperella pecoris]QTG74719.1 di-trans,poly-cis-decaprenylcistransferase [Trueperella pecoris]